MVITDDHGDLDDVAPDEIVDWVADKMTDATGFCVNDFDWQMFEAKN